MNHCVAISLVCGVLCCSIVASFLKFSTLRSVAAPLRRLQMGGHMTNMATEAEISLVGDSHYSATTWKQDESGSWYHEHSFVRPGWQKTSRCSSDSAMDCEECVGGVDCWSAGQGARVVQLSGNQSQSTRYLSTIHVRCDSVAVNVSYEVQNLQYGQLRILWDGVDVSAQAGIIVEGLPSPLLDVNGSFQESFSESSRWGTLQIEASSIGGHTLELEFVSSSNSSNSGVAVSQFHLAMSEEFAECADYQACLDAIATDSWFRNNNTHQLMCLQGNMTSSPECGRWLSCLSDEKEAELRALLQAAGVKTSTASARRLTATSSGEESSHCLNPSLQDPAAWACDCLDDMQRGCEAIANDASLAGMYTETLCLRAQMCSHSSVCSSWKEEECDAAEIQQIQALLDGVPTRRALQSRAGFHRDVEDFDRALSDKTCV